MRNPLLSHPVNRLLTFAAVSVSLTVLSCSADKGDKKAVEAKGEAIFSGKDLTGWDGDAAIWTVVDGVITGTTTDEAPLPYNRFLIFEGEPVEDFVLSVEIKLTGNNNSGIQYRSKHNTDLGDHVVTGYQCDMHAAEWANGMLYDEKERGILAKRGQKVVITEDGKAKVVGKPDGGSEQLFDPGEWHTYTITARGNHLVHAIDGVTTVEIYDHQVDERDLKGTIAFQVHRGPAMKVEIRKVLLERLQPSGLVLPAATPIPDGALDVNPPKPKAKGKGKKGGAKAKGGAK
jgi:hypothetical protein